MSRVVSDAATSSERNALDTEQSSAPRASRDLRRRFLRHYLPLGLASAVALVVFMNLPFFDANRYAPPGDLFSEGIKGAYPSGSGAFPGAPTGQGGGQPGGPPTGPSDDRPGGSFDHSGPPGGIDHGGSQSETTPGDPGGDEAGGSRGHGGGGPGDTELLMRRYSTATGYVALGLLGLTLLIGPATLLARRRIPVSSYLRRDVGICAAIVSVVHMVFGFLVKHADGILSYFFEPGDRTRLLTSSFGLANWAGLAAVVIVVGLAAISSDAALRKLKAKRWKRIQRLNYALFALVIAHALLYGALWRETSPYTVLLGLAVIAVLVGQAVGVRIWRQRSARAASAAVA